MFGIGKLYSGADRLFGGYLPGAHRPAHEMLADKAGDVYNDYMGISSAREANKVAQNEAQKNREFQERMSSTAIQRAVADMKKAGLNPILAAGGGLTGGASTPAGSMASTAKAEVQGPMLDILRVVPQMMQASSAAVASLATAKQSDANTRTVDESRDFIIEKIKTDIYKLDSDMQLQGQLLRFLEEMNPLQLEQLRQAIEKLDLENQHSRADLSRALNERDMEEFFSGPAGNWLRLLRGFFNSSAAK